MSNSDSFFEEVAQEVRRDKLYATMRRYGWIPILAVVAIVGFASWNEWTKARNESQAQAFGDSVLAALDQEIDENRYQALRALAETESASAGRDGIVQLLLAAQALEAGERDEALTALAQVEANATLPVSYRQLATYKRVVIAGDALSVDEREAALAPLAAAGQAYRPLALEQLALLRLEAGDSDGALNRLQALLNEPDLTSALRQRVAQVIVILGGEVPSNLG